MFYPAETKNLNKNSTPFNIFYSSTFKLIGFMSLARYRVLHWGQLALVPFACSHPWAHWWQTMCVHFNFDGIRSPLSTFLLSVQEKRVQEKRAGKLSEAKNVPWFKFLFTNRACNNRINFLWQSSVLISKSIKFYFELLFRFLGFPDVQRLFKVIFNFEVSWCLA